MHFLQSHITVTLGLVLTAALLAGMFADLLRLPKVTGFLLVGVVLGPSVLDLLDKAHVHTLEPLTQLAIGLVLFSLGCQFPASYIRRILRRLVRLSAGELALTFLTVSVGMMALGQSWSTSLLLGALAMATAPATTILVMKEIESEGPVTEYVSGLVILNNFASIAIFEIVFLAIRVLQQSLETPVVTQIGILSQEIAGSLMLGILGGLVTGYACNLMATSRWLVLLVAMTTFQLGLAETMHWPFMLSFLSMGLTVASVSHRSQEIVAELERLTGFLCVVFFVIHGAELNLLAFVNAGLVGAAYILLRIAGKYLGIYGAARLFREPEAVRRWLGTSMLAQAGAAIALASLAARRDPDLGKPIQVIILGTVVFFEIIGPLLIRFSMLRAGEVPLVRAVHHTTTTPLEELGDFWTRLRTVTGLFKPKARQGVVTVGDLTSRNVPRLNQSSGFNDVIDLIEHSHDNTYAVLDSANGLVGVIRFADLSRIAFDHSVASLVRAEDLASPVNKVLYSTDPISRATELFRTTRDDCLPVLTRDDPPTFTGVLRRRDLTRYHVGQKPN